MVVRVINERIVHTWVPNGFFVLHLSKLDEHAIVGAATCARGGVNWIWLASSHGYLRRVRLERETASTIHLEEHFLSGRFESVKKHAAVQSDHACSLDIGDLYSISTANAKSCSSGPPQERCNCVIEVFATRGYTRVGAHDGLVSKPCSLTWQGSTDGVALVQVVREGPLRNAIVQPGFSSPALIVTAATGSVRVVPGSSYFYVHNHMTEGSGLREVANMNQTPVWQTPSRGNDFFVVLGCFRAGIVLFPGKHGTLSVSRFVLKGGSNKLTPYSVVIVEATVNSLTIEEISTGRRTSFAFDRENSTMRIDLDSKRRLTTISNYVTDEDQSSTFRNLLRGIETLGEREKLYESECKSIEELISSYNVALIFVSEWKERNSVSKGCFGGKASCKIAVDLSSATASPRLQLPNPLLGREVFATVSFRNETSVTLGDGWMLRVGVFTDRDFKQYNEMNVSHAINSNKRTIDGNTQVRRVMSYPLKKVAPGAVQSVSFPVIIDSHAPFNVSVALAFHHPVAFALSEDHVDIEVPLLENFTLDILRLSRPSRNTDIKDTSHELLSSPQVMGLLNPSIVEKQRGYPTISRFEVPFSPRDVREALSFTEPSASFETPLGAHFTVTVADVSLRDGRKTVQLSASSVALRGVPHVLSYVRAAILRLLLQAVSHNSIRLRRIAVRDRENIKNWLQLVVQTSDECLPTLRNAETKLVEALRYFRGNKDGENDGLYHDNQKRDATLSAFQSAKDLYIMWRRENERLWTPKGAASVSDKKHAV